MMLLLGGFILGVGTTLTYFGVISYWKGFVLIADLRKYEVVKK